MSTQLQFPEHAQVLFKPKRFKVLWGGRGAGRSWNIARALLVMGTQRSIRVLCCRELQKSISESVHKVLSDQIEFLGLSHCYRIEVAKIYGMGPSLWTVFSFEGIKNNTTAIKSYEGIDYCWVEEANKVSKASWAILIPTVRKETPLDWRERGMDKPDFQSEIWVSFNPELETDYTYTRFVKDKRLKTVQMQGAAGPWTYKESPDSFVVKMTYADNPWFPEVLRSEMEAERVRDYDNYLNVWEGQTILQLEGAVFKTQLRRAREEDRITTVPWEREVPVDTFWDLGRRDYTGIWFGQFVAFQFRVLEYLEDHGPDITHYIKLLQNKEYTLGHHFLPHDAKHKKLVYKHSIEQIIKNAFGSENVTVLPRVPEKFDSINAARLFFPKCYFDETGCADGLAHLNRYRFKVVDGQFSKEPFHDPDGHSDCADAFMEMARAAQRPAPRRGLLARIGLPASARGGKNRITGTAGVRADGTGWMR